MENNLDIFIDSDIRNIVFRIRTGSKSFEEYQDFLIHLLYVIDSRRNNYASKDDIINGFKTFKAYLSEQELYTLISKLNTKDGMYSMEDLYNCLFSN